MGRASGSTPTVLVVDDEPAVCDLYARYLPADYEVLRAYGGQEALETLSSAGDVDAALLDRQMPGVDGDETLEQLREAGHDCRVAMVTAVEPDFDIVELPFDAYVTKPVERSELVGVVRRLLRRAAYAETVRRYYALVSTAAALAEAKPRSELRDSEQYRALTARIEALADAAAADLPAGANDGEWAALLDDVLRNE